MCGALYFSIDKESVMLKFEEIVAPTALVAGDSTGGDTASTL